MDPVGWGSMVIARFVPQGEGAETLRRVLTPDVDLDRQTLRYRLRAGSPDIFVRSFRRTPRHRTLPKPS